MPVAESFGLEFEINKLTNNLGINSFTFDHWEILNHDPFMQDSKAWEIFISVRKRKGLKLELPDISHYIDKL